MRLFLLFLFTAAFFFMTNAQAKLVGTVKDAESGEPIFFANIALYRNGVLVTGAETDFDGFYSITEIEEDVYDAEITFTGYAPIKVSGIDFCKDFDIWLDIKLQPGQLIECHFFCNLYPIIEQDNTTQGMRFSSFDIMRSPFR